MTSRILDDNLLDLDLLAADYVSSEQTAFPITNIYNQARRSKVWRSNGYWEITSSNNSLVFRESNAGPDLTATIPVDEYASTTTFLAAIKTAMEVVGASTYTITQDTSTKKIKFVSDGSGGTNHFQLRWPSCPDIAEVLGFDDSASDSGALTYYADLLRIGTSEWIKWDFGISTNPQAFCLIGQRNSPISISPSAVITLQGNETDVWTSPSYETVLESDDQVIYKFKADDDDGLHTEALRFWRLLIEDLDNPNGYIEAGAIFLGNYFEPDRGAIQIPFNAAYVDRSESAFSEGGQSFSDVREKTERFTVEWFGLTVAEKEDIDSLFDNLGTSTPFFVAIDPNAAMSSRANYFLRYVKFEDEPSYTLIAPGVFQAAMRFREEL